MGTACNCSKSTQNIKDTVPNGMPIAQAFQPASVINDMPLEDRYQTLTAYKDGNQAGMHKKIIELYNHVQGELSKGVVSLKLNTLKMKEKDWAHFTNLLAYCGSLKKLNLWKVTLTAISLSTLGTHLMRLERLEILMLGDMNLGSFPLGTLAEALKKLLRLKELILTVNYLNSEHMTLLLPSLLQLQALETLSLDENELGNRGADVAAVLADKLPRLTDLSLKFNSIGTKGLTALLPMVGKRRGMIIRLDGNDLNDDEYDVLEQAHHDAQV